MVEGYGDNVLKLHGWMNISLYSGMCGLLEFEREER